MARKTGVPTMLEEAQSLQTHITQFTPVIQGEYSGNDGLIGALADCAACLVNLIQELGAVREKGD